MNYEELFKILEPSIYAPTWVFGEYTGWRRVADRVGVTRRWLGPQPKAGHWFYRLEMGDKVTMICSYETYAIVWKKLEGVRGGERS